MPEHALADEPSMGGMKEAVGKPANDEAVGTDKLSTELLKLGHNEGSAILRCIRSLVLTV